MYRITIYIGGKPILGKPVDKETVERTLATFLENDVAEFKVEKIFD